MMRLDDLTVRTTDVNRRVDECNCYGWMRAGPAHDQPSDSLGARVHAALKHVVRGMLAHAHSRRATVSTQAEGSRPCGRPALYRFDSPGENG